MKKSFLFTSIGVVLVIATILIGCEKFNIEKFADNDSYWAKSETINVNPALNTDLKVDVAHYWRRLHRIVVGISFGKNEPRFKNCSF